MISFYIYKKAGWCPSSVYKIFFRKMAVVNSPTNRGVNWSQEPNKTKQNKTWIRGRNRGPFWRTVSLMRRYPQFTLLCCGWLMFCIIWLLDIVVLGGFNTQKEWNLFSFHWKFVSFLWKFDCCFWYIWFCFV